MDRQRMHRLGKHLIALSRQVDLQPEDLQSSPSQQLVLGDVVLYPGSTIREIVQRTGFTQGYVSKCVAELADVGLVSSTADESDRRRTLVTPSAHLVAAVRRRTLPMRELIEGALADPRHTDTALAMLDELSALLLP